MMMIIPIDSECTLTLCLFFEPEIREKEEERECRCALRVKGFPVDSLMSVLYRPLILIYFVFWSAVRIRCICSLSTFALFVAVDIEPFRG